MQWVGTIRVTQKISLSQTDCPDREFVLLRIHDFAPAASSVTLVLCSRTNRSFTFPNEFPHPTAMSTIQPIAGELEPHPDVALVDRVRGGDVSAYDTLVRKYDRQIFRIAQHITQNREDAEDVMQDAFLKAYEKLDQFQGNSKFYTWLVRIAVNESLMRLRKRRTGKMVSIDEDIETEEGSVPRDLADWAPDPEQNYNQAELGEILRKTIQGLPQGFRIVFVLRDVEGLSTEETAETLGLSIPAVKSRLLRARLQLRERLSRYFRRKKVAGETRNEK
jgi:RNA polymerase sigma-70 factor (ECF subfamily)